MYLSIYFFLIKNYIDLDKYIKNVPIFFLQIQFQFRILKFVDSFSQNLHCDQCSEGFVLSLQNVEQLNSRINLTNIICVFLFLGGC